MMTLNVFVNKKKKKNTFDNSIALLLNPKINRVNIRETRGFET